MGKYWSWPRVGVRRFRVVVASLSLLALVASCAEPPVATAPGERPTVTPSPTATAQPRSAPQGAVGAPVPDTEHVVEAPGRLAAPLLPSDMLVYSADPIDPSVVAQIAALDGVEATEQLSLSQVSVANRVLNVAAVDPASYRRYTPVASARLEAIWARVAGGEVAILPELGDRLEQDDGYLQLGNDEDAPRVHIGAYAPQVPQIDAVVNTRWGEELGMRTGNALLVSTGSTSPQSVRTPIERLAGDASVQILGPDLDLSARQTAFLTGGSVAEAVGTFSYRASADGTIDPVSSWVSANIRTERVPILGDVTCHRAMLPQLRAALSEVVKRGLADAVNPEEFAGCYYPRYIAGSTQLSLHSFGIAVDLNVPGNQRGTVGEIDRTVVEIFKSWGFAWGGDWNYTDPMHFELAALVKPR